MNYQEMRELLKEYNWDDGFEVPRDLLDNPQCDLAMALEIFDLADGYSYFCGYLNTPEEDLPPEDWKREWLDFVRTLYRDILAGRYPKTGTVYKAPYNRVQKYKFQKLGVPDLFLSDLP